MCVLFDMETGDVGCMAESSWCQGKVNEILPKKWQTVEVLQDEIPDSKRQWNRLFSQVE